MSDQKVFKVKFWTYLKNFGDGSFGVKFFKSEDSAKEYASYDDERACDDISFHNLEFDVDGNLTVPEPEVDSWVKRQAEKRWAEELERKIQKNEYYKNSYPDKPELWKCTENCAHEPNDWTCKVQH